MRNSSRYACSHGRVPPSTESQVTKKNQRDWPYSQWAFQNFGARIIRSWFQGEGDSSLPREESRLDQFTVDGASLGDVFAANAADALVVIHGDTLVQVVLERDGRAPPAHLVFHDQVAG